LSDRAFDVLRPGLPGARRINAAATRMRIQIESSAAELSDPRNIPPNPRAKSFDKT
jgi:hypothetical protein